MFLNLKSSHDTLILKWTILASLTYVFFVPVKGRIRYLSAKVFKVLLASKWWWSMVYYHKVRNWESLCDISPDCHHNVDASGTKNTMFHEFAPRSLISPLAGTEHTFVRLAIIIHCKIPEIFSSLKKKKKKPVSGW